jgi:hypothetical protein
MAKTAQRKPYLCKWLSDRFILRVGRHSNWSGSEEWREQAWYSVFALTVGITGYHRNARFKTLMAE